MLEELELMTLIYKILILLFIYFHKSILNLNAPTNKNIINDGKLKQNISNFHTNIISVVNNTNEKYIKNITLIVNNTIGKNISNFRANITSFNNTAKEQYIRSITFNDNNTIEQNKSNFNGYIEINIDNQYLYEDNIDFSNYTSEFKVIAFYSPKFILTNDSFHNSEKEWSYVINAKPLFDRHNQPRKPADEINYLGYYNISGPKIIKKQVELAKSHGIFGFGIYYYWSSGKIFYENILDIYLNNKDIDFPFFLIWKNGDYSKNDKNIIKDSELFIKDIKKYVNDSRYIKINGKPVVGINQVLKIQTYKDMIKIWKEKAREYEIGDIYILINLNNYNIENITGINLFDAAYDFPPFDGEKFNISNSSIQTYTSLIYHNSIFNSKNFTIFRGSMLEWDDSPLNGINGTIFEEYSPEKFFMLNKLLFEWTKENNNSSNKFVFINSWNEWSKGSYLEPDQKYGYASINALSKALFNLNFRDNNYNLSNLINSTKVAVQAHIYYYDLVYEIIKKTNNIPVKFDLYITTVSNYKKNYIERYMKGKSKANKYEITIVKNKGRDVLPLLIQFKNVVKSYKYLCHIHTKKSKHDKIYRTWRQYLYDNLLGSEETVSEILTDFENNEKLGFILPESYNNIILNHGKQLNPNNKKNINFLLNTTFPDKKYQVGKLLDFPIGNMFWSRVSAVHQIFELNISDQFPKEKWQTDFTIMHAIERFWLFLVKLNGFYYKKIFKSY